MTFATADAREEADVLRQQVDAVVVRMREADFEFARQVLRAVDRFLGVQRRDLLPALIGKKHLVVSRTPRRHLARHRMRQFVRVERQLGIEIVDRTRDRVAIHVAARAERRELVAVVNADSVLMSRISATQIVPAHVVELDALARGQPEAAVGVSIRGRVEREPLRGRELAARES